MTTKTTTVTVTADPDSDDCLSAAAESYIEDRPELEGYDLDPQWEDEDDRTYVVLTVPSSIASLTPDQAWERYVGSQSPREFVDFATETDPYDACLAYANSDVCTCDGLSQEDRDELTEKLFAHVQANV